MQCCDAYYALAPENKMKALTEVTQVLKCLLSEPEQFGLSDNMILIGSSAGGSFSGMHY